MELYDDDEYEEEEEHLYEKQLEAISKLRSDYGPPESYPEYTGWEEALYCHN
jgi:hypothetical protein